MDSIPLTLDPLISQIDPQGKIPPVDRWHPERCGDMDLTINTNGCWIHEGTPITRLRLLRLLSTILRREPDGDYFLVTPVEKLRIRVQDRPFLVVDADREEDGYWWLTTNVGDRLRLDSDCRLSLSETPGGDPVPEVPVRLGLIARLGRNVYYRLIEQAEMRNAGKGFMELGFYSHSVWQPLGRIETNALHDDHTRCT